MSLTDSLVSPVSTTTQFRFPTPVQPDGPATTTISSRVPHKRQQTARVSRQPARSSRTKSQADSGPILAQACVHCQRSKVRCQGGLPCDRCVRLGSADTCSRVEAKKRGRKSKRQLLEESQANNNALMPPIKRRRPGLPADPATDDDDNKVPGERAAHVHAKQITITTPLSLSQDLYDDVSSLASMERSGRPVSPFSAYGTTSTVFTRPGPHHHPDDRTTLAFDTYSRITSTTSPSQQQQQSASNIDLIALLSQHQARQQLAHTLSSGSTVASSSGASSGIYSLEMTSLLGDRRHQHPHQHYRPTIAAAAGAGTPDHIRFALEQYASAASADKSSPLAPPAKPDAYEQENIQHFSAISALFYNQCKHVLDAAEDKPAVARFLWFCSDVCNLIRDHLQRLDGGAASQPTADRLAVGLATEVNAMIMKLCGGAPLPKAADDSIHTDIEKQVYKRLPFGVMMLPLAHRPFNCADRKPWTNDRAAQLLGYTADELKTILSQRQLALRLTQHPEDLTCAFWEAALPGRTQFTRRPQWRHKSGELLSTVTTYRIKYVKGLPVWLYVYIQDTQEHLPCPPATPHAATSSCPSTSAADDFCLLSPSATAAAMPAAPSPSPAAAAAAAGLTPLSRLLSQPTTSDDLALRALDDMYWMQPAPQPQQQADTLTVPTNCSSSSSNGSDARTSIVSMVTEDEVMESASMEANVDADMLSDETICARWLNSNI